MDVGCRWSVGLSEVFPGVRVGVEVPEQRFSSESWLWIRAAPHPAAPAVINVCLCTELGGLRVTAGDTPRMEVVGGCGGAVPCCDLPSVVPNCAFSCARFIACPSTREASRAVSPTQRATLSLCSSSPSRALFRHVGFSICLSWGRTTNEALQICLPSPVFSKVSLCHSSF